jgi:hypothetical protein
MAILCDDCKNFQTAYDPEMMRVIFGYCLVLEYPFMQAVFKPETLEKFPQAFPAPTQCDLYEKGKKKG